MIYRHCHKLRYIDLQRHPAWVTQSIFTLFFSMAVLRSTPFQSYGCTACWDDDSTWEMCIPWYTVMGTGILCGQPMKCNVILKPEKLFRLRYISTQVSWGASLTTECAHAGGVKGRRSGLKQMRHQPSLCVTHWRHSKENGGNGVSA